MDYRELEPAVGKSKDLVAYALLLKSAPDVCPPLGSPEFLKIFPLDPCSNEGFRRMLAAAANGYGD